jgi:hypothetical protein
MSEKKQIIVNCSQALNYCDSRAQANFNEANKTLNNTVNIVLTLSTSILLLSGAFIDKIFPLDTSVFFSPKSIIYVGWLLLITSIISGIAQNVEDYILFKKVAQRNIEAKQFVLEQMRDGKDVVTLTNTGTESSHHFWFISEIQTFIVGTFAVFLYSLIFIVKGISGNTILIIFLSMVVLVLCMTRYFICKLEKS